MNLPMSRLFCILFFTLCLSKACITAFEISLKDSELEKQTFLVSAGGSGNTWTRYCLEFLTKRPTLHFYAEEIHNSPTKTFQIDTITKAMTTPINNTIPLGVDYSKPAIIKIHHFANFFPMSAFSKKTTAKFILLIRNPKECLLRSRPELKKLRQRSIPFFSNLQIFDQWNPKTRILIYYEDLIQNPRRTLKNLLDFLGESDQYLNDFMLHFAEHKQNSLDFYAFTDHVSHTKGNKSVFHSKGLTPKEKFKINKILTKQYPDLWKKYLTRYSE